MSDASERLLVGELVASSTHGQNESGVLCSTGDIAPAAQRQHTTESRNAEQESTRHVARLTKECQPSRRRWLAWSKHTQKPSCKRGQSVLQRGAATKSANGQAFLLRAERHGCRDVGRAGVHEMRVVLADVQRAATDAADLQRRNNSSENDKMRQKTRSHKRLGCQRQSGQSRCCRLLQSRSNRHRPETNRSCCVKSRDPDKDRAKCEHDAELTKCWCRSDRAPQCSRLQMRKSSQHRFGLCTLVTHRASWAVPPV
jgi:hypothetical protein